MKALVWLRLIDEHDGNISLTNIALLIALVKLAVAPSASIVDIGALFISLASYQAKKVINKDEGKQEPAVSMIDVADMEKRISDLSSKVSAAQLSMGFKELR